MVVGLAARGLYRKMRSLEKKALRLEEGQASHPKPGWFRKRARRVSDRLDLFISALFKQTWADSTEIGQQSFHPNQMSG